MLGSPAGPGGPTQRGLWPLAPAPIPSAANFTADGYGKYGLYSFLPGSPTFGSALYSHSSAIGRFATGSIQPTPGTAFHAAHKVSDSLFASAGYTFGAPTPPPGSPYSPVPVTQLEVLTKGFNTNSITIQQPEYSQPSKKHLSEGPRQMRDDLPAKCCKKSYCSCSPVKAKYIDASSGCSRTNPVDWNLVSIKKEPGATPCQVAEVTTSDTSSSSSLNATIKVEVASPTQKTCVSNICHQQFQQQCGIGITSLPSVVTSNGSIPVGIAVARQRIQHQEIVTSPSLPPITGDPGHAGLLTTIGGAQMKDVTRISDLDAGMAASSGAAGVAGGGTLLQCPPDDRTGGFASWSVGGAHNSALATPTLWQYPAHLPMEPLMPMPLPMPPVGFQLVRDHNTGGLLLLPTTSVEQLQQVVWPSYQHPTSHVLLPPNLPPPPLQLLSSSSDYLQTSTTLHQHTQTHSTRLLAVTTDKRKLPMPIATTTLIKIESEVDQSKAMQAVSSFDNNTGTVYTDPNMGPLVTTHVIYQHPSNLILSQTPAPVADAVPMATCRSQATSPVTCLTPPPDCAPDEETSVQDASNQTDAAECDVQDELPSKDDVQTFPSSSSESSNCVPEITVQEEVVVVSNKATAALAEIAPQQQENRVSENQYLKEQPDTGHNILIENVDHAMTKQTGCASQSVDVKDEKIDASVDDRKAMPSPDLFGLELLSNSIVEFEKAHNVDSKVPEEKPCCSKANDEVLERIAQMTLADVPRPIVVNELGGLDLLCTLAEQRLIEEMGSTSRSCPSKEFTKCERKPEKRKAQESLELECETKQKQLKTTSDIPSDAKQRDNSIKPCTCRVDSYRTYKTKESEQEAKRYLASKSQTICCNSDWPCMNAMELDMRMRLADLQRKYREKQKELSKLKPKRHEHREKQAGGDKKGHRSRKKSINSDRSTPPPPLLDKMDMPVKQSNNNKCSDLLKPPTLCPYGGSQDSVNPYAITSHCTDESPHSIRSLKSSKKRKVGRPKKLMSTSGLQSGTETIVAKKPKKGNLVGYLLAAKEKLIQNNSVCSDPPRFVEESYGRKEKKKKKIWPRLKAAPVIKASSLVEGYDEDIEGIESVEFCKYNTNDNIRGNDKGHSHLICKSEERIDANSNREDINQEEDSSSAEKNGDDNEQRSATACDVSKQIATHPDDDDHADIEEEEKIENAVEAKHAKIDCRCQLTTEHLEQEKLRVLTAMGGLFYAGRLNAVEPPDVYSITLDGERGNRPHIMSREEILRDAILEVSATSTKQLAPGTRLCAYWSQQYRCLYPGSVAEPESPNPELDNKFVSVEFDDGDSGRIPIEDIRLLPVDYPIIEYDPNPLLSLCKKRRRASTVDERRSTTSNKSPTPTPTPIPVPVPIPIPQPLQPDQKVNHKLHKEKHVHDEVKQSQSHKERKKLKKKKRDKLRQRLHDEKKKRKKHKCAEENCKHRKHHKKHRKHKKHHHHEESSKKRKLEQLEVIEEEEEDEEEEEEEIVAPEDINEDDVGGSSPVPEISYPEYHIVANPEDEVTMDDILEAIPHKNKKIRDRQESCESRSKMSAFLPARQLWGWSGKGYKRPKTKGRSRKQFYRAIQRGKETIQIGDSAVFLSTGRPDRPYIGKIEAMWESCITMVVKVKWFYHPEETVGCPLSLKYPGALFESPHIDENDVQTISHKCEVLPLKDYTDKLGDDPKRYANIYDNNDIYYLAGYYDPTSTTLKMEPDIPFNKTDVD